MKEQVQIYPFEMAQFYCKPDWCFIQKDILAEIQLLPSFSTSQKQQKWCDN